MFNFQALLETLPIMGKGMAGIFVVSAIIILVTVLLNKITAPRKSKKNNDTK